MTIQDKKYLIKNQANQLVASDEGDWCHPESIHAREFTRDELIDFENGDPNCNHETYYDNSGGGSVVIGWAEDDSDTPIAVAIEAK